MYVVLELMKFDVYNVNMYISFVFPYVVFNKSLFLLDHKEKEILDLMCIVDAGLSTLVRIIICFRRDKATGTLVTV